MKTPYIIAMSFKLQIYGGRSGERWIYNQQKQICCGPSSAQAHSQDLPLDQIYIIQQGSLSAALLSEVSVTHVQLQPENIK